MVWKCLCGEVRWLGGRQRLASTCSVQVLPNEASLLETCRFSLNRFPRMPCRHTSDRRIELLNIRQGDQGRPFVLAERKYLGHAVVKCGCSQGNAFSSSSRVFIVSVAVRAVQSNSSCSLSFSRGDPWFTSCHLTIILRAVSVWASPRLGHCHHSTNSRFLSFCQTTVALETCWRLQ